MNATPVSQSNQQDVYTGRTTSWSMVASTSLGALLIVVMSRGAGDTWTDFTSLVPLFLVAVGVIANLLTASSVRAAAGPNGFTIRWGPLGWPRTSHRLDEIATAEVIDLPWWRVSYGYWWTPNRTSCTVRRGKTVRLVLESGRIVTATVPEPEAAVAALRGSSERSQLD